SFGKGDSLRVNLYLGQMTAFLLVLSLVIGAAGIIITPGILRLMKTPSDVSVYAAPYMRIIFAGLPFMFLTVVQQFAYQGIGNGIVPLAVQGVSVLLNVILDPLFIFGLGRFPAMGVAGAAWATIIARSIAAGISMWLLVSGSRGLKLKLSAMRPKRKELGFLIRIGLPSALGQSTTALGFTVLQGVINSFGTPVIAAFGIANRLIGLFNMPAMGVGQATAALVGQSLGANRPDEAKRTVHMALISVFVFLMVTMSFSFFFGNQFTRFFVDDPEVIRYGAQLFRVVSVSVVFFGMFMVYNGVFQGAGYTKVGMILGITRLWGIRLPLALLIGRGLGFGASGIWWAMFISNLAVYLAALVMYRRETWMTALKSEEV
ncbi:MAG: MATE family efflux transporter, partial [Spirochaetaceae bacterium]|nr:MATE family efflux transporter [Spirochaetaceae bacterium]